MIPPVTRILLVGTAAALLLSAKPFSFAASPALPLPAAFSLPVSSVPESPESLPRISDPAGPPPPAAPEGFVYWKTVSARVTAYDPTGCCCGHSADGRTSVHDNAWVMDGVAADPEAIPYRTRLWIPGAGWREVDDTGSAMKQSWREGKVQVDLRVPSHGEARRWGSRQLALSLYRPAR